MALHKDFPRSPYEVLNPDLRWFPAAEELRSTAYEKLLPPLVAKVREEVNAWRDAKYAGASATSRALLTWWFETAHTSELADGTQTQFRYYFAQREAVDSFSGLFSQDTRFGGVAFTIAVTSVPEPAGISLSTAGLALLLTAGAGRRRSQSA